MSEQLSRVTAHRNGAGKHHLSVIAKRTYRLRAGGPVVSTEQVPLSDAAIHHVAGGQGGLSAPAADVDCYSGLKSGTDVIIQATAHSLRGPVASMDVSVAIASSGPSAGRSFELVLRVFGDRSVQSFADGGRRFSAPQPFTSMPIRYDRAYGGHDIWAEQTHADEGLAWLNRFSEGRPTRPYDYPRNPAGRGYLIHSNEAAFASLALPNIERPDALLTPTQLCTGDPHQWHKAPVPGGFDWVGQAWFPRLAFLGLVAPYRGRPEDVPEVASGWLPSAAAQPDLKRVGDTTHLDPFFHGASPGLIRPTFTGTETLLLRGLHAKEAELSVELPRERPTMFLEPPKGQGVQLEPAIRTVVIQPDQEQLVLVWEARLPYENFLDETLLERCRHAVRWREQA